MANVRNFTPTINSDNRFDFLDKYTNITDEIVIGGSCMHVFEFPFVFSTYAKSGTVYYKQGLNVILEIPIDSSMITECAENGVTIIKINLTPLQTQNFESSVLDTFSQIRLVTKEDEVLYGNLHKVAVINPLKVEQIVGN